MDDDFMPVSEMVFSIGRTWLIMALLALLIYGCVKFAENHMRKHMLEVLYTENKERVRHG